MGKEQFRKINFRKEAITRISQLASIVKEYQQQNLRLTARQLYYQCVSRALIPNKDAEYKRLTALLTDARYAGMIDWDAIEDRGREPNTPSQWDDPAGLVESALRAYRLPRWADQDYYVELWVEKQALAGVLEPIARAYHATLMVNKGYSSASAMKESADRLIRKTLSDDDRHALAETRAISGVESGEYEDHVDQVTHSSQTIRPVVLYLGDHDPSGEDMVRDIEERLGEFGVLGLKVEKVGLTIAQVRQYNPPPNPAKITDPRAKDYIAKFGNSSWEVDALPPQVLTTLIRRAFDKLVDREKMDAVKAQEELDKELLRKATAGVMKRREK